MVVPAPTGKRRGRKAGTRVPCDDCIVRASEKQDKTANLQLCSRCTAVLSRPKTKPEQANSKKSRRRSSAVVDAHTNSVVPPWSEDHMVQHALQFFIKHSAPHFAGYLDSTFWHRMVAEAGGREPAIIHALAAIGSLHETILTGGLRPGDSQDKSTDFALRQCNRSIQFLMVPTRDGSPPDLRLMLTTCVLYTYFEALQGHSDQAINHAQQGFGLVQGYAMDTETIDAFRVELDQLNFMMNKLQSNAPGLTGKDKIVGSNTVTIDSKRPAQFTNLTEARSGLELVLTQLTVFFMDMELDDKTYEMAVSHAQSRLEFNSWLRHWEAAFSSYLTQVQAEMSPEDRKAAMTLKTHHLVAEILSGVDLSLGERGWDTFNDKFSAIVDLAAAVLTSNGKHRASNVDNTWQDEVEPRSKGLSFNLGIFDALYEVCARCRDMDLQKRALALITCRTRQDYMSSSWSAWKVDTLLLNRGSDGPGVQPTRPLNITSEPRTPEEHSRTSYMSNGKDKAPVDYHYALQHGHPRRSLNPGLFQSKKKDQVSTSSPMLKTSYHPAAAYSTPPAESSSTGSLGPSFESFEVPWYGYAHTEESSLQYPTIPRTPPID